MKKPFQKQRFDRPVIILVQVLMRFVFSDALVPSVLVSLLISLTVPTLSLAKAASEAPSIATPLTAKAYTMKPKLLVVLVIDQLRADYLTRFSSRFLPARDSKKGAATDIGGFRYLIENGAYFPFAQYDILQSMTCPGHATILTGAFPYSHGIPINTWYDQDRQKIIYCVEDDASPIVGVDSPSPSPSSSSVAIEARAGLSPRNLKTTTVGDELKTAGHSSKVISIALKDRAAIMLGGHSADLALWFDAERSKWISSRYYLKDAQLPAWVNDLNQQVEKRKTVPFKWVARNPETGLSNPRQKGPFERQIKLTDKDALSSALGVHLTTEAALAALKDLKLGQHTSTDLLAVSYSSHDMLGHKVGPNAREMEELTVFEDQSIAELLRGISTSVPGGLKNVMIVLTGDHGVAPSVPTALANGVDSGGINPKELTARLNEKLKAKLGPATDEGAAGWIANAQYFNFFLNRSAISARKLTAEKVETELKNILLQERGVEAAFSLSDYRAGRFPPGMHERQIKNTYIPGVSGDVVMIPKAFFAIEAGAEHMTGYNYDRVVPLIMTGPNLRPGVYATGAQIVDLAPTLSFLLGVVPPAHAEGRVLSEAIGN